MLPGEDELEDVVSEVSDDDEPNDDDLHDFDDELPAGEGAFAEASDGYRADQAPKVALKAEPSTDVKALLRQVRRSKKRS
jgi:hypothetical protein